MFKKNCLKESTGRLNAVAVQLCVVVTSVMLMSCQCNKMPRQIAGVDVMAITTENGGEIGFCNYVHGSVYLWINGKNVYVDPVSMFGTDYSELPKADMIMVTHEHPDHLDLATIVKLAKKNDKYPTYFYGSKNVVESVLNTTFNTSDSTNNYYLTRTVSTESESADLKFCIVQPDKYMSVSTSMTNRKFFMHNGFFFPIAASENLSFQIKATKAYNYTDGKTHLHPAEREDVGYIIGLDDVRIYIAGDTEDIPEMEKYGRPQNNYYNIAVAFLPINSFTMNTEQAVHAARMLHPGLIIPYHTDKESLEPAFDILSKEFMTVCQGCSFIINE